MSDYYVHPTSVIDERVFIGKGTKIWHFCHIQSDAIIGENCSFGQNVNVSNHVRIGNGCKVQNNVSLYEGVELEDYVFCGPIVCGHTIGKWAMIAAGAVVTSDVPNHALMMGVPGRLRGWVCECGDVLSDDLVCNKCGRTYREVPEGLEEVK